MGFTPLESQLPDSDFKQTYHVLQVSVGAKTKCKMTAWVLSFDSSEKIDCAAQSLMSNLRKTRFLTVSGAFLSVAVSRTRIFFNLKKNVFFRENWWGAFRGFLLRFPVIYVYVPFFGPVPKTFVGTGWVHGVKKTSPKRLPTFF